MAQITTYSTLKQNVADWLSRSDLTDVIPNFIQQAEARLNRKIRCRAMETTSALSLNASGEASLPSDFLEFRTLSVATSPVAWPELVEPDSDEFLFKHRPYLGPQYCAIAGGSIIVKPAYNGSATLYYYQKIAALTDAATTNWLLLKAPECYLYSALLEAAIYLRDEKAAAAYSQLMTDAVADLLQEDRASQNRRTPVPPLTPAGKAGEAAGGM